jgi:hypothetical protein
MEDETHGGLFPLESVGVFVGTQKMTSDTGNDIRFWAQRQLAKKYYGHQFFFTPTQFDCINWVLVHRTLHKLPRLFQIWAAKQVLGVTGTMKFLANQDKRSPLCPSCLECKETCTHIAWCPESERSKAFHQSTKTIERWLGENKTHPDLQALLLLYLHRRGLRTCQACVVELSLPPIFHKLAQSQDTIGWDNFAMGMISTKLLALQSAHIRESKHTTNAARWVTGLITQLLQVGHTQWIYQCVLGHDRTMGTLILQHKAEMIKEIEYQLDLGKESLAEEDRFLLECNFDNLSTTAGESQGYWLLAIRAAREAS